jgi:hypothetical protein
LTKGDFEVGDKPSVDAAAKVIRYVSNEGNPLEQQLWQVDFAGEKKQLSSGRDFTTQTLRPPVEHLSSGSRRAWIRPR